MKIIDVIKRLCLGSEKSDPAKSIMDTLQNWSPSDPKETKVFLDLSKRSLDEVTRLTGYEDEKANHILTAMAFLSALAGVIFASFVDKYHSEEWTNSYLVASVYLLFVGYILTLGLGAVLVVYAVRPRFKIPPGWGKETGTPGSFLFFKQIIATQPDAWAQAFTSRGSTQLQTAYIKNSILETYLIALKVRDKLTFLEPGVFLLWLSTLILFGWLIVYGVAVVFAPLSRNAEKEVDSSLTKIATQLSSVEESIRKVGERGETNAASSNELMRRLEQQIMSLENNIKHLANRIESLTARPGPPRATK